MYFHSEDKFTGCNKQTHITCLSLSCNILQKLDMCSQIEDMQIHVDIGQLQEMVQQNEILIEWIDGRLQFADVLTKAGASAARLVGVLESSHLF